VLNDILNGKTPESESSGHVYREAGTPGTRDCTSCKGSYSTSDNHSGLCGYCLSRAQYAAGARIMQQYQHEEARGRTGRIVAIVVVCVLALVAVTFLRLAADLR
jgi:hypothetical protein